MKRTTIFIPEVLEADLQRHAKRVKLPVAHVVREAIAEYLTSRATPTPLPASLGMGKSGRADLSERFDELLFADVTADDRVPSGSSRPAARRRRPKAAR